MRKKYREMFRKTKCSEKSDSRVRCRKSCGKAWRSKFLEKTERRGSREVSEKVLEKIEAQSFGKSFGQNRRQKFRQKRFWKSPMRALGRRSSALHVQPASQASPVREQMVKWKNAREKFLERVSFPQLFPLLFFPIALRFS